jgi:hypothetical protein
MPKFKLIPAAHSLVQLVSWTIALIISSCRDLNNTAALKKIRLLSVGCVRDHAGNALDAESTAFLARLTSASDAVHTTLWVVEFFTSNFAREYSGLLSIQRGTSSNRGSLTMVELILGRFDTAFGEVVLTENVSRTATLGQLVSFF